MMSPAVTVLVLVLVAVAVPVLGLLARLRVRELRDLDTRPWASTLSYVATAYGVVVGFSIIFLFDEFSDAREAVGQEATAIGTAFDEVELFPEGAPEVRHALICYARAVPEFDWPALQDRRAAPEVDRAYQDVIGALGEAREPSTATFQGAAATNILVQVGEISSGRETRLVAAETEVPWLLWGLLIGGGLFVVALIFVVTLAVRPVTQSVLVGVSAAFTAVMLLIVGGLSAPFGEGVAQVTPKLIEQTAATMEADAPAAAARPCSFDAAG
jgi:amino acid transporter